MKEKLFSVTKKDFRVDYFRAGGKGGQHQNKTSSACRITHLESGAVGESREQRSQPQNKKIAFKRCIESETFQRWLKIKTAQVCGAIKSPQEIQKEVDEIIKRDSKNGNIKVEVI